MSRGPTTCSLIHIYIWWKFIPKMKESAAQAIAARLKLWAKWLRAARVMPVRLSVAKSIYNYPIVTIVTSNYGQVKPTREYDILMNTGEPWRHRQSTPIGLDGSDLLQSAQSSIILHRTGEITLNGLSPLNYRCFHPTGKKTDYIIF